MNLLNTAQIQQVLTLIEKTGQGVMDFYNNGFEVKIKKDDSPVTEADLIANQWLEEGLSNIAHYPILSEENIPAGAQWLNWETYWLIDPIDGTKHFINHTGEFCICVALIHQNQAIFGLIYMPTEKTAWYAQRDENGVFKVVDKQINLLNSLPPPHPIAALSSSKLTERMGQLIHTLPNCTWFSRGSALKYIAIVEGEATFYPKMWLTSEWDSAAGQCLVECAGGSVIRLDNGQSLRYGQRDSLINPHFIAYRHLSEKQINDLLQQYQQIRQDFST
ncbi:MAG: 3'(2'),5'-bisphosphate nucleotidase CysQ family protein [Ostreibacterium sp.]